MALCFVLLGSIVSSPAALPAQTSPPATRPLTVQALPPGWEEIDQRFLFLAEQLMLVENEVTALNKALVRAGYQQAVQQANAERAVKGNDIMDRRGGGPVDWWTFYGTTAEKFFYHPNGPRDFYETRTFLIQRPSLEDTARSEGVPSRQGLPVHQRPPQFDYFYRANDKAKQRAEQAAAAMGRDIQRLVEQRRQREAKQAEFWCLLSLRGVTRLELSRRPTYRFHLKVEGNDRTTKERHDVISATAQFIRTMNQMLTEAQDAVDWNTQPRTFAAFKKLIATAQQALDETLLKQPSLIQDLENKRTPVGMVAAAAARLVDASQNLLDAQAAILEKDRDGDDLNKLRHRALLQQAVFDVAANVQTLDECFRVLVKEWKVVPDVEKGLVGPVSASPKLLGEVAGTSPGVRTKDRGPENTLPSPSTDAGSPSSSPKLRLREGPTTERGDGFIELFNGKDLAGWKGVMMSPLDNPAERSKRTPRQLAEAQREADEIMRQHWTVKDGVLVFDGRGRSLSTAKDYGDFEMYVDWKIAPGGDSGIYLRGMPQVQLWDPNKKAAGGVGSGGLYNNQRNPSKPTKLADKAIGEWNTLWIKMVGPKVWVKLNGELVVSGVVLENYWERNKAVYRTGPIELQNHQSILYFKNIYIKELTGERAAITRPMWPAALPDGKAGALSPDKVAPGEAGLNASIQTPRTGPPDDATTWRGHRYKLNDSRLTWHAARSSCEAMGGHLAVITSREEQAVVTELAAPSDMNVWIGFSDERREGRWEWVTGETSRYTNWEPVQPLGREGANVCQLRRRAGCAWDDRDGTSVEQPFVCEWESE
jgi:hypothetical protein